MMAAARMVAADPAIAVGLGRPRQRFAEGETQTGRRGIPRDADLRRVASLG